MSGTRNHTSTVPRGLARLWEEIAKPDPTLSEEELDRRIAELRPEHVHPIPPEPMDCRWHRSEWSAAGALLGYVDGGGGDDYQDAIRGRRWATLPQSQTGANHFDRPPKTKS